MNFSRRFKHIICRKKGPASAGHQGWYPYGTLSLGAWRQAKMRLECKVTVLSHCVPPGQRCCIFLVLVSVYHFSTLGRLAAVSGAISLETETQSWNTTHLHHVLSIKRNGSGDNKSGIISQVDFTLENKYFVLQVFCSAWKSGFSFPN